MKRSKDIGHGLNGSSARDAIRKLSDALFIVSKELGVDPIINVIEAPHPEAGVYLEFECNNFNAYERVIWALRDKGL